MDLNHKCFSCESANLIPAHYSLAKAINSSHVDTDARLDGKQTDSLDLSLTFSLEPVEQMNDALFVVCSCPPFCRSVHKFRLSRVLLFFIYGGKSANIDDLTW